ncbi:MAG: hypothetical protein HYY29_05115 [Chloroflexi bacterium]|nr:hypothetical protein [Chloroflexota bacterium]
MNSMPGYAGRIARVDLSTGAVSHIPTENYSQDCVGGQGIAARIYWDEVPASVRAFDPGNRLIFANGPCAGFQGLAGARWVVFGKSPATDPEFFSHCNLGGSWGVQLKAAGFDALVVQGKADSPVYLLIEDGKVKLREATRLWGKGAIQVQKILKTMHGASTRVVAAGPAGDNMVVLANLMADNDSSGTGSLGAVMGSKNLKAIAVKGSGKITAARPEQLEKLLEHIAGFRKDSPITDGGGGEGIEIDHCAGCTEELCNRGIHKAEDGSKGKFMCQSGSYYKDFAAKYYGGEATEIAYRATRLCDDYGLNTKSVYPIISWLQRCQKAGILSEKSTGLPLSKIGSMEFIQSLLATISFRRDFGELLAQGLPKAAASFGKQSVELLYDDIGASGERMTYMPKAFISTGILYALDPRQPIQQLHEVIRLNIMWVYWATKTPGFNLSSSVFRAIARRAWGSELGADFSTYEGKALAAKMIQDRQLAKECGIFCDTAWPLLYTEHGPDHLGDPSLEGQVLSNITGRDIDEQGFYRIGERLMNLQRAILLREGRRGRQDDVLPEACFTVPLDNERKNPDCLFPGKDGEVISKKGALLDRNQFQRILGEHYELRGWNRETGLPTKSKLEELGLGYTVPELQQRGLLSPSSKKEIKTA